MINIDEALKDTGGTGPAAKIKLLSSRIAVEEVLSQKPDLKQVFERCQSELDSWNPKRAATDQPTVIGWINLAAEIARRRTDDGARAFSHSLPHAGTPTIFNLLALLDLVCYKSSDTTGVRGLIAADGFEDRKKWPTRHESWRTLLLESAEEKDALAKTDLGQTLVMHLLEAILPLYERATRVDHRGQFNLIVVPLIRAIFRYPDRAHTAYTRYMYGADRSGDGDAFELLYDHDLVVIAEFQRYATSKRSETLSEIRNLSQSEEQRGAATPTGDSREFPELPPALKRRANRILHGEKEEEETVHSPRPKRIRVSQLTCLVRQLETSGNHAAVVTKNKEYSSHMKGTRYRRMNMTADDRRHFKWVQHEESKQDAFLDCVRERYAGGYGADFLGELFGESQATDLPVWVQDGEVTFLWLLTALCLVETDRQKWIDQTLESEKMLPRDLIVGKTTVDPNSVAFPFIGKSLYEFATTRACLFENNQPGPKAWALVNFLERVTVYKRIAKYAVKTDGESDDSSETPPSNSSLATLAATLYEALLPHELTFDIFKAACLNLAQLPDVQTVTEQSRFPTFLLELILRNNDNTPYSLFFYPINFDDDRLPSAFLAGTFAGLEWSFCPSVTDRQNCHLFALIDALRPIVDFEIGRVLVDDRARFSKTVEKEAEAKAKEAEANKAKDVAILREKTVSGVMPAVKALSKLFHDAQGQVFRIQASIDPDWGGLFTRAMDQAVTDLFESSKALTIEFNKVPRPPEPCMFKVSHEIDPRQAAELLYNRLVYLAREKFGYEDERALRCQLHSNPTHRDVVRDAFQESAFLSELFLELTADNATCLSLLFRLLTIDAANAGRGLHVAQVAAALGMTAGNTKKGTGKEKTRIVLENSNACAGSNIEISGSCFSPKIDSGITELAKIMKAEQDLMEPNTRISTGDFTYRVPLPNGMEPFRFLRALSILGGEALSTGREGDVKLVDWKLCWTPAKASQSEIRMSGVAQRTPTGYLRVTLECHNQFDKAAKASLWAYVEQGQERYHNLRTNFRDLCLAVGSPPVFVACDDQALSQSPDAEHPFLILEGKDQVQPAVTGRPVYPCHFKLLLGCSPNRAAGSQADLLES